MEKKRQLPKRWFGVIRENPERIIEACNWYRENLDQAFDDMAIEGNLQMANQLHPGLVAYYNAMHTDLDMIEEYCKQSVIATKARRLRQWIENPPFNTKVNETTMKSLLETDEEVIEANSILLEVQDVFKKYTGLMKVLNDRGYSLNNITKLRIANMEEVEI